MKKFGKALMVLVGLGLIGGSVAQADSTNTVTNAFGQVITVITTERGAAATAITPAFSGISTNRQFAGLPGLQISEITGIGTRYGEYTPRDYGDMLFNTQSNWLYVAAGLTTSSWRRIAGPLGYSGTQIPDAGTTSITNHYVGGTLTSIDPAP